MTDEARTPPPRIRDELAAAWTCAVVATAVFAAVEIVATVIAGILAPGDLQIGSVVRFAILGLVLAGLALPLVGAALSGAAIAARLATRLAGARRDWPGLFAPLDGGARPATAWFWGVAVAVLLFVAGSTAATAWAVGRFKEPTLTGVLLAVVQLALIGAALFVALGVRGLAARAGAWLDGKLGRLAAANPLSRPFAALFGLATAVAAALLAVALSSPRMAPIIPWRGLLTLLALAAGLVLGRRLLAIGRPRLRRRTAALIAAGFYVVIVPATLVWWGAHSGAKALAVTSSPAFARLVDGVRQLNDVDRDGFGSLLGETDCAPFDADRNPLAPEIPDNGIDENCDGRDLELARLKLEPGETAPVPDAFKRDWNFLLITIDTVRYDHTSFGGYAEKKGRDTTPELAKLVDRSVSFSFANAPSAGTMASVPSIMTSKFFHSGIAMGPNRKGKPPLLGKSNLLIPEALKARGYRTGALVTHYYFNEWGIDQGFDTYDNSLGRRNNPKVVSADRLTDRAVAWISRNAGHKWFLWTHYIDPHGHYVDHPGGVKYGDSEEDRYDGELHFTDHHVGRLLREISRISGIAENTVVIVTSDHGDGFNEHGFTSHAKALYFELLHVPLIVYVPSIRPRVVPGPVSPLDIFPTILDLAGIDRSRLSFEGRSLVPQLFYDRDARDRVVFAETDYPKPQRAAISDRYKLIRRLQDDLYELYDLRRDPREQRNLHPPRDARSKAAFQTMNRHLEDWLERVYYRRDRQSNQLMMYLAEVLLKERPEPTHPVEGATYDSGNIEVLGFDIEPARPKAGDRAEVSLYFRAASPASTDYKIQVVLAGGEGAPQRTRSAFTSKGRFPTSRWRPGEFIRDTRKVRIRANLTGEVSVGMRMTEHRSAKARPPDSGEPMPGDANALKLGTIEVTPRSPGGSEAPRVP